MKILLTNDDGYRAEGINALANYLSRDHEVVLIAPDREKSAASHCLSLSQPLRIFPVSVASGVDAYSINGNPADCVKLGLAEIFSAPPDLVVSGINAGSNIGIDIHYSGTVAAAKEGVLNGIPALAMSLAYGKSFDFSGMAEFTGKLIPLLSSMELASGVFLNVNAPPNIKVSQAKGIRITRQSQTNLSRKLIRRTDPRNHDYFWYGQNENFSGSEDTDITALKTGYISITPISCDLTHRDSMEKIHSLTKILSQ